MPRSTKVSSAAYDFALDAEDTPEEYLRLVEAQGLKIQLRSPMKPVVKLAFDGMCDEATIKQLEAILAWAFDEELPRGTLAERIESRRRDRRDPGESGLTSISAHRVGTEGSEGRIEGPFLRYDVSTAQRSPDERDIRVIAAASLRRAASPSTTASTAHLRDSSVRVWRSSVSWTDRAMGAVGNRREAR